MLTIVDAKTVGEIIFDHSNQLFDVIKQAYLLHESTQTVNPPSYFLRFPEKPNSRIIALPAYIGGDYNVAGIKWIASNPDNIKSGLPRASAVLILNDYDTGFPFALLESAQISASRTSISSVLAAEYMNAHCKDIESLGFVGNGFIARNILHYFKAYGWKFKVVYLYDLSNETSARMAKYIAELCPSCEVVVKNSVDDLVANSEVAVFTTTAASPYFNNLSVVKHNPILLNVSLRDIDPKVLLAAQNIVDDLQHVLQASTSPDLAQRLSGNSSFINGTLAQLIKSNIVLTKNSPRIFSPMGLGILDLAVGKFVFDHLQSDQGVTLPDFFRS